MVKEIFLELYNNQKEDNNFLSEKDVLNLTKSFLNGIIGKWGGVKNTNNIIFGLKSGVVFYESYVMFIINRGKTQSINYNSKIYPNSLSKTPLVKINKIPEYVKMNGSNLKIDDGYQSDILKLSTFDTNFFKSFFKLYNKKLFEKHNTKIERIEKKERKDLGIPKGMILGKLLIKIEVRDLFGKNLEIKLYNNRLESKYKGKVSSHDAHTEVHYFGYDDPYGDGRVKVPLSEFSNMRIETGNLNGNGKPCLRISAKQIYEKDGSGGQNVLGRLKHIDPAEKKKLKKVIFYFENFKNAVEIKDLERLFLESEKNEIDLIENTLKELDKDNNGIIDIIEVNHEFNQLLKKHQKIIIEKSKDFNQNYTHDFIKVGNYLKEKRNNIQLIYNCLQQVDGVEFNEFLQILKNDIYSYNLLLINSLNLIVSLIEDDQITFYEIYENFDKLNIYNSNWENEMSQKLTTLNKGISELNKGISELNSNIKGLMYEIRDMGDKIVDSIGGLSYITEKTNMLLDRRLSEIDSTLKVGNLISVINTYQNYKINQNTKSLRK